MMFATNVIAQITNSAMSGKVVMDDTKEEVIGATVQAVHDPSGTKYAAVTNENGRFTIQGMRNGGPGQGETPDGITGATGLTGDTQA